MESRDTKRHNIQSGISDYISLYLTLNDKLILPKDYEEIKKDWDIIYYRGTAGEELFSLIEYNGNEYWVDPLTWKLPYYYLTKDKKGFFINICYEWKENIQTIERSYQVWYQKYEKYNFDLSNDCK